jgi:hypothetical protein
VGVPSSRSTMVAGRIRALTAPHPIKPTSTRCQSAWRHNPGGSSTYRRGKSVQTTGTSCVDASGVSAGAIIPQ